MTDRPLRPPDPNSDDLLWKQLKSIPAFRALLRAVEARFYQHLDLPQPVLDVGCGDGHFSQMTFDHPLQVGIDPWWGPLNKAVKSGMYALPLQATGDYLPFPDQYFASALSNSVLEHIPSIQPVLDEVGRVLQPNAPFVITVPSHHFSEYLGGGEFLNRIGLDGFASNYRTMFNRLSRHAHTDPPEVWAQRLAQAGFVIERWQYYFSHDALHVLELGHAIGLPSAIMHALTGHWIIGPWESNLKWTERWVRPYYEEDFPVEGAYIFILARREIATALSPLLPAANPFTLQELAFDNMVEPSDPPIVSDGLSPDLSEPTDVQSEPPPITEAISTKWQTRITVFLVGLTLLFAFWGQSVIQANPHEAGSGLRWLVLSGFTLLLLLWYRSPSTRGRFPTIRLPDVKNIPKRRWLYILALFLALLATRLVFAAGEERSYLAIVTWLIAIGVACYSLYNSPGCSNALESRTNANGSRFTLVASITLFLAALLIRMYDLSNHPFILNGTEASIGLDALNTLRGITRGPFSTGWLTNPTLPLFLLAIPLQLLGPTVFALRLLSSIIGALTVVATFLIGQRLYGRIVGLAAAIILLGSHFHVHFSRLGLTNVWDALLVLLSLGLITIAWQQPPEENRSTWLLAGLAAGWSAYLYTSSHILPLMLFALMLLTLIFERENWRKQGRNAVAMMGLALVVALPQLLYYQANPDIFMERATALGILDSQSGWLSREMAHTGATQLQLWIQQLSRAALAYNATLDTGTSYGPFIPLLNFVSGVLAFFGFIMALLRLRQLRYSMLVVWITSTIIFAGAMLENPPGSHRYIITAPAVSLIAAIALVEFTKILVILKRVKHEAVAQETTWSRRRVLFVIIPLLIATFIAVYDIGYYFGPYRNQHHFADRNTEIADVMAGYLNTLEGDWSAYFYGAPAMYTDFPTIPFLASNFQEDVNLFDVLEPGSELPVTKSPNVVFLFLPERYGEMITPKLDYPYGKELSFDGYYSDPLFHAYEVRKGP